MFVFLSLSLSLSLLIFLYNDDCGCAFVLRDGVLNATGASFSTTITAPFFAHTCCAVLLLPLVLTLWLRCVLFLVSTTAATTTTATAAAAAVLLLLL
jgi:glucan phosphoethanolaminetransferase (alkaline phosphatase superfamily)